MLPSQWPVEKPIQVCGRVVGRMRAVVHPDGAVLLIGAGVVVDRDQVLRLRIALLPDAELQGAAIDVGDRVDLALVLRERQTVRIPAQGPLASLGVDRNAEIIDQIRARECAPAGLRKIAGPRCRTDPLGRMRGQLASRAARVAKKMGRVVGSMADDSWVRGLYFCGGCELKTSLILASKSSRLKASGKV